MTDEPDAQRDVLDPVTRRALSRRSFLRHGAVLGGAALAGPSLLAACGSSGKGSGSKTGGPVKKGGTLTVGLYTDITDFDPYHFAGSSFPILRNLNSYLFRYDDKLHMIPDMATGYEIASDNKSVTVKLRAGQKFQTGNPVTAGDVVFGLKRAADPVGGLQLNGPMSIVKSYSATDSHTVQINFTSAVAKLLITDLLSTLPVVDQKFNTPSALAKKPASAGPFQLVSWQPGNSITIKRYPGYWNAGLPHLDQVVFKIFSDANAMDAALESGQINVSFPMEEKNAQRLESKFTILQGYPGALVHCLRLNPRVPPYDNQYVRQAIQRAINRDLMVSSVMFGQTKATALPWGVDSPAYDASYNDKLKFDLDAAKSLLAKGGSPKGGMAYNDSGDADTGAMLQIIQSDLKKIGFDLTLKNYDTTTADTLVSSGKFPMAFNGLGNCQRSPSRIDTNSIFRIHDNPVWASKLPEAYVNAINATTTALTPAEVKQSYASLNEIITTEAVGQAVAYLPYLTGSSKSVSGVSRSVDDELLLAEAGLT